MVQEKWQIQPTPQPRAFSINTVRQDDVSVVVYTVQCSGKLTGAAADILRAEIKRLIPQSKRIVLDLTDLTQLDSLGLGTIVSLYVSAKAAGCDLKLIHLRDRIRDVFRIANLLSVFEYYGDIQIAAGLNQIGLEDPPGPKGRGA